MLDLPLMTLGQIDRADEVAGIVFVDRKCSGTTFTALLIAAQTIGSN